MQQQSFHYRNQLIAIYHSLQEAADGMYIHAFQLALNGELKTLTTILEDGDRLPGDVNYLKSLKSPVITALAELIDDILILQESIFNVNALSPEEVALPGGESTEDREVYAPGPESEPACLAAERHTYASLLELYVMVWQLANSTLDEPEEVIDQFGLGFYDDEFRIPSEDANVLLLLDALNSILEKNTLINYWSENY